LSVDLSACCSNFACSHQAQTSLDLYNIIYLDILKYPRAFVSSATKFSMYGIPLPAAKPVLVASMERLPDWP
jgi:hypothetical protein